MKRIATDSAFIPHIARELALTVTPYAQCIACLDGGELIAGVIYDDYNTISISAHIWIKEGRIPCRDWYGAIFDYPFNYLSVIKIIGKVISDNQEAIKLDSHFGFIHEATVTDYHLHGDLYVYTMTRDQCKVLTTPRWEPIIARLATAR